MCYTSGGSRGNPGIAGAGVVARTPEGETLFEGSQFLGNATNSFAEYAAVVLLLNELKKRLGKESETTDVEIHMDSELVQKQLSGNCQIEEPSLVPQFIEVHNLRVSSFPHVKFVCIEKEDNADANRLAHEAMDRRE